MKAIELISLGCMYAFPYAFLWTLWGYREELSNLLSQAICQLRK